jgi:predicted lipid-binding transport protein (Tim44 family)
MKGFLLLLLGLVLGGILGALGGGVLGTGLGAGAGIVTGLQSGACLAVEAAREKGLISAEQVDEIFAAAAQAMQAELPPETEMADTDAECREVVAKLKASMAEN